MHIAAPVLDLHELEKLREQELEEARAIQSVMLPGETLRAGRVTVCHEFQPVAVVGGDFLDYFELSDGSIGMYLGDVSGKGLPATLYAALTVGTLRGVHKTGQPPSSVLATLNRRLMIRGMPRRHAAMQYAVYDPIRGEMRIASAGMPGPIHLSARGCHVMELCGIPPGLLLSADYEMTEVQVEPGDQILFCSDGITDAMNVEEEQFGLERLQAIAEENYGANPEELLSCIFAAVSCFSKGHEQHDDMAAIAFQC